MPIPSAIMGALSGAALLLVTASAGAQDRQDAVINPLFSGLPADLAGKRMTVVEVTFPPGAVSSAHRHPGSVYAYVLEGRVRSQLGGEAAAQVYEAGQFWYEPPGAHHIVASNASDSEPARILAVLIGDDGAPLVTND